MNLTLRTFSRSRRFRCSVRVVSTGDRDDQRESLRWALRDLTEHERALERDALHEQAQRKDEFLAALGHELRNPLAAVSLAADRLQQEGGHTSSTAAVIARHSAHLKRLVDDLLDAARVRHGKIELRRQPVELSQVLTAAAEQVERLATDKRQRVEVRHATGPLWVDGDPDRLQQIAANLLENACKYTGEDGHITACLEQAGTLAVLSVRDDGVGIAPAMLDSIFGAFEQAPASSQRRAGGLGLGLSLVRELVTLHGGDVHARSDGPGRGSEFVVTLPLRAPARAATAPDDSGRIALLGPTTRVLVADDNADAAEILGETLARLGHEVHVVTSGHDAVERAVDLSPRVAVVDLHMPDMDGFEVARRLRDLRPDTVLVALTGFGDSRNRAEAHETGFQHYLLKPIDVRELDRLLRAAASA